MNIMNQERRKSERLEVGIFARSNPLGDDERCCAPVTTRNVSRRGAYFVTQEPPRPGDELVVTAASLQIFCEVRRVDELSHDLFGFAVTFLPAPVGDDRARLMERTPLKKAWSFELKALTETGSQRRPDLQRVVDYVEKNPSKAIKLPEAARIASLEATYFSAIFHKTMGVPFREWLQYIRVRKALRIMNEGDSSISEIAYAVGFTNLRTFERTFKKWTNMNPRTFATLCRPEP